MISMTAKTGRAMQTSASFCMTARSSVPSRKWRHGTRSFPEPTPSPASPLDRLRVRTVKPTAEAEEDRKPLIAGSGVFPRKLTNDAPDPPLINRSQLVDQRKGFFGEAA